MRMVLKASYNIGVFPRIVLINIYVYVKYETNGQ